MRVKLLKRPPEADIADLSSETFDVGRVYDLNTLFAFVCVAEG
jgi:signal transduction histidine kinase